MTVIKRVKRADLEVQKYNACVLKSNESNRLYGQAWFLDAVTNQKWDCLVYADYQAVMPLPIKTMGPIRWVTMPLFAQQLGIYGAHNLSADQTDLFGKHLKKGYIKINWRANTVFDANKLKLNVLTRINLELNLNQNYTDLEANYNTNTKRNIKKGNKAGLLFKPVTDPDFIFNTMLKSSVDAFNIKEYAEAVTLLKACLNHQESLIYGVYTPENQLISAALFCNDGNRTYYLWAYSTESAKQLGASHFLLDAFIEANCAKPLILDFEGSMIPGVAIFYKGFGALEVNYYSYSASYLGLEIQKNRK